jgi:hypothetical protein
VTPVHDLVVLTAGADEREALRSLLSDRTPSLGIRRLRFVVRVHVGRDAGCFHKAPDVLQVYQRHAAHGLVLFDREGSGQEAESARALEDDLRHRLARSGWRDRADVVVIDPELERWVWADSPHLARLVGWSGDAGSLRSWLDTRGLWTSEAAKPERPKEALQATLRHTGRRRSAALYGDLGRTVGLARCLDPAFQRLTSILRTWFPREDVREKP